MGEYVALNAYYRRRRLPFLQERESLSPGRTAASPGAPSLPTGGPPDNTAHAGAPHPGACPGKRSGSCSRNPLLGRGTHVAA